MGGLSIYMIGFFGNLEVKKMLILVSTAALFFSAVFLIMTDSVSITANKELIRSNGASMEILIEKHPDMKEEIIRAFTKEPSKDVVRKGEKIARQYGFDENLYTLNKSLDKFHSRLLIINLIFMIAITILIIAICLKQFSVVFSKITEVCTGAEKIISGNYSFRMNEYGEGKLGKLSSSFNKMSSIVENSMTNLNKEKEFLKDTMQNISHQLKTPLASLKIFNELSLENKIDNEDMMKDILNQSKRQLDKMEWLIISLLNLAKIDSGTMAFNNRNSSIKETLEECIESLASIYKIKHQSLTLESSGEAFLFHDKRWLVEAFSNIIKNSIENTGNNGEVKIYIQESPILVKVTIKDNGQGISKENLPHIFERFYKCTGTYNRESTGIGLSLSKSIIESQKGFIAVKSEVGVGTTFEITFLR